MPAASSSAARTRSCSPAAAAMRRCGRCSSKAARAPSWHGPRPDETGAMLSLVLKCVLGAAVVLVIALLSRTRSFYIAGLVPLFPTFALIAHAIVGSERSPADLRVTAL